MIDLNQYGWDPSFWIESESKTSGVVPARITAVYKERFGLVCAQGHTFGRLKTSSYLNAEEAYPTVGDFVQIEYNQQGDSRILHTLKRKSYFSRLDPSSAGHGEQAVAANFDAVFIMQSLNHDFNLRRLERYLTLAWQSGAEPVVVLTKADLAEDATARLMEAEEIAVGAAVYTVSAKTGSGIEALRALLQPGKTAVFLGSSGVGKSSLVNALAGEEIMQTSEIREDDSRGRHTTTHRELILLESGVMVIDTPGMRELGMWDVSQGLGQSFADVEQYFGGCRFSDCRHEAEPGCAVKQAIESGMLPLERWESYQRLKNEARYSDDKAGYLREKQQWHKQISKFGKTLKKNGGIKR